VQQASPNPTRRGFRLRRLSWAGVTFTLFAAACQDDAIVYPNRNLTAPAGGAMSDAGIQTEGGEAGTTSGGMTSGGSGGHGGVGGSITSGGGDITDDDAGVDAGSGGMVSMAVCGNKVVEPPEECDDGNTVSGDGCSSTCKSACEICEKNVCPLYDFGGATLDTAYDGCLHAMGTIATGDAQGAARKDVCAALVDCIHTESCGQTKGFRVRPERCWCDLDWTSPTAGATTACKLEADPANPTDPKKFIAGKCAQEFKEASEGSTASDIEANFTKTSVAEGAAYRLISNCDARNCTEECLPSYFEHGTAAKLSADITALRNDAGESALGDLVADALRSAANADFAIVENTFIAEQEDVDLLVDATPSRAADSRGTVLWSEARAVHIGHAPGNVQGLPDITRPWNQALYKATLTGQQIYDVLSQGNGLHVSGLTFTWDAAPAATPRVIEVRKVATGSPDGALLDKAAMYTVALGDQLVSPPAGTPTLPALDGLTTATVVVGVDPPEALGQYLSVQPQPVAPPTLNRIKRLN
jgi:cysteine-rich repeat protein